MFGMQLCPDFAAAGFRQEQKTRSLSLFDAAEENDSDVKIFPTSGRSAAPQPDDDGADEFVRERDNGNLEKAKRLGRLFARHLRHLWRPGDTAAVLLQKKILYGYVVAKVIEKRSPNSVLEQAALGEFYREIRSRSPQEYDSIQDSVAFTKYLLSEHSPGDERFGGVFAEQCGRKGDPELCGKGILLYYRYTAHCMAVYNQIQYA